MSKPSFVDTAVSYKSYSNIIPCEEQPPENNGGYSKFTLMNCQLVCSSIEIKNCPTEFTLEIAEFKCEPKTNETMVDFSSPHLKLLREKARGKLDEHLHALNQTQGIDLGPTVNLSRVDSVTLTTSTPISKEQVDQMYALLNITNVYRTSDLGGVMVYV